MREKPTPRQLDQSQLLRLLACGERSAIDEAFPMLYDELHRVASGYLAQEKAGHTLQPTALVHESYVRLIDNRDLKFASRAHFIAFSAVIMRRILIDHARLKSRKKRGDKPVMIILGADLAGEAVDLDGLLAIDAALRKLEALDARQVRIVELRFFGGLSCEEAAEVLGLSKRTIETDWSMARAWLKRELGSRGPAM